jgi:hypothetical protein
MELKEKLELFAKEDPFKDLTVADNKYFLSLIKESFLHHIDGCEEFKKWCIYFGVTKKNLSKISSIHELPYVPSSAFKALSLHSIEKTNGKSVFSSGTSSSKKSEIFLDTYTSSNQKNMLANMLTNIIGPKRLDCFIFDSHPKHSIQDKDLSGRVAGMNGYLLAAKSRAYILDSERIDDISQQTIKKLNDYIKKNNPIYLIGYTFMLYQLLIEFKKRGVNFSLPKGSKLVHFGGWKRMQNLKVEKQELNKDIIKILGMDIKNIYDIYGFTEQLGTIYPSSGNNYTKIPTQSRVIVRDTQSLLPVEDKIGFLQFINPFPYSYPGISILQDDLGLYDSKSDSIHIIGRLSGSEERGCGDTINYDERL